MIKKGRIAPMADVQRFFSGNPVVVIVGEYAFRAVVSSGDSVEKEGLVLAPSFSVVLSEDIPSLNLKKGDEMKDISRELLFRRKS